MLDVCHFCPPFRPSREMIRSDLRRTCSKKWVGSRGHEPCMCFCLWFFDGLYQGKSWMHLPPPFGRILLLVSLVPSTSKMQITKQLNEKISRWGLCCLWQRTSYSRLGQGFLEGKWTYWDVFAGQRRRESPKKTTKTKGLYGSPIVYFECSPPKTSPVPAVRFRGCTTEMCCPKNQPWSQNLMVWRSQKPYKESKPSIGAGEISWRPHTTWAPKWWFESILFSFWEIFENFKSNDLGDAPSTKSRGRGPLPLAAMGCFAWCQRMWECKPAHAVDWAWGHESERQMWRTNHDFMY